MNFKNFSLVSIVVPSLNQGRFIKQTLDSIILQDFPNIEIIVMDGRSTDGTLAILRKYGKQVSSFKLQVTRNKIQPRTWNKELRTFLWISEKDKGQADAINKGLRMATGEIVGYINSDDYYEAGALKKIMTFFQNCPHAMWVTGDCRIVDENGREIQRFVRWYKRLLRYFTLSSILPIANPVAQPSTFWRRELMKKVGYFNENLCYAFDYDFWLRMMNYSHGVIQETLSSFRIHGGSKGGKEYCRQFDEEQKVANRYVRSKVVQLFHRMHARAITFLYDWIK
jgi:glycosyltransferase involved in cell wall biosynthesis